MLMPANQHIRHVHACWTAGMDLAAVYPRRVFASTNAAGVVFVLGASANANSGGMASTARTPVMPLQLHSPQLLPELPLG